MPDYVRAFRPGGTFFLTLVTERRTPVFASESARAMLGAAFERCRKHHPFVLDAIVCLPDHLHMLMTLPDGDADFSLRVGNLKSAFTRAYLAAGGVEQARSASRVRQRARGVWLKRFWEHTIRDCADLLRHYDYIHYNPVKHKHATCPHAWPHSSFHRFVAEKRYEADWCCRCDRSSKAVGEDIHRMWDDIAAWAGE
jgi:putative transposase